MSGNCKYLQVQQSGVTIRIRIGAASHSDPVRVALTSRRVCSYHGAARASHDHKRSLRSQVGDFSCFKVLIQPYVLVKGLSSSERMEALQDVVQQISKAAKGLDATFQVGGSAALRKPVRVVWEDPPGTFVGLDLPGDVSARFYLRWLPRHFCEDYVPFESRLLRFRINSPGRVSREVFASDRFHWVAKA